MQEEIVLSSATKTDFLSQNTMLFCVVQMQHSFCLKIQWNMVLASVGLLFIIGNWT